MLGAEYKVLADDFPLTLNFSGMLTEILVKFKAANAIL